MNENLAELNLTSQIDTNISDYVASYTKQQTVQAMAVLDELRTAIKY